MDDDQSKKLDSRIAEFVYGDETMMMNLTGDQRSLVADAIERAFAFERICELERREKMNGVVTWGKYKGDHMSLIIEKDYQYAEWLYHRAQKYLSQSAKDVLNAQFFNK
jgi:hypothetical protein